MLIPRITESSLKTNFFQGSPVNPIASGGEIFSTTRKHKIQRALPKAVAEKQFKLSYQPQWDARGQKLLGVEALIRWRHAELGDISPTEFIPLAEESGSIMAIGEWVLQEACRQYQIWQKQDLPHFLLGVNMSLQQLQDPNFVGKTQRILEEAQMPAQQLQLEVTEGLIFKDLQRTVTVLKHLQQAGIRLAIDDFGTGYSSLSVLKNLPIHTLKIDKSFLDGLETPPKAEVILGSIINLGQRLQLSVVAEGVETSSQRELLQSLRCDVLQGFFFSRPLNGNEINHYLHHSFSSPRAIAA